MGPVVMVISTEIDKPLASLVKELDKVLASNKDAVGFLVFLSDDKKVATEKLKTFGTENAVASMALTVNTGGAKLPDWLKVDPAAKHTVILYKEKKVVSSTDFKKEVGEKELKELIAATTTFVKPAEKK